MELLFNGVLLIIVVLFIYPVMISISEMVSTFFNMLQVKIEKTISKDKTLIIKNSECEPNDTCTNVIGFDLSGDEGYYDD